MAGAEARRQFGNVGLKHEESREIWMTRFLSQLGQDIRYGCRTLIANKPFSALAVLSLALGIGASRRKMPFPPDRRSPLAKAPQCSGFSLRPLRPLW